MPRPVVVAPDGRRWVVRRRWLPRLGTETVWGRFHGRFRQTVRRVRDTADADPGCLADIGEGVVAAIVVTVGLLLLVFVLFPLLLAVLDLLVILLLALLSVAGRVLLRRPWTVEASSDDDVSLSWKVVGWGASAAKIDEVSTHLAAGIRPPADP
ncbi:MAG: hypothetical protein ACOYXM_12340 [Actinomycetota bacterium]